MAPLPHFPSLALSSSIRAVGASAASLSTAPLLNSTASSPLEAFHHVADQDLPPPLAALSKSLQLFASLTVVWFGIVIWDTLATLHLEYRYVWRAKWSWLKVAFLINRWWTSVCVTLAMLMVKGHISPSLCSKIAIFHPIGALIIILACDCILSIRIYALYNGTRKILWTLVVLLMTEASVMAFVTSKSEAVVVPREWLAPVGYYGCAVRQRNNLAPLFWGGSLLFEVTCLALFLHRIVALRRKSGSLPILTILFRHGVFYFLIVFLSGIINIVLLVQPNEAWQVFNPPASVALISLMASRLVLSLHAHKDELSFPSSVHRTTLPTHHTRNNTYPPPPPCSPPLSPATLVDDQKCAIPLGAAFCALATPPLKNDAFDLSMDFADAGDLSGSTLGGCESSCGVGAGSSPVKSGRGRKAFEGARSTYYPDWTPEVEAGSVRFVDLPRPVHHPSSSSHTRSASSSVSSSSSSASRPPLSHAWTHPHHLVRSSSHTPASTPYVPRPTSPPSLTALPPRSSSFTAGWAPTFPRRLSPIPSAASHRSSSSAAAHRLSLEGRIAVERETVVSVDAVGEGDGEDGGGWGRKGEIWTGEAL
ncbi:hypothetical protein JCM6882_005116 [Rhodosporidiobolus microsporus]